MARPLSAHVAKRSAHLAPGMSARRNEPLLLSKDPPYLEHLPVKVTICFDGFDGRRRCHNIPSLRLAVSRCTVNPSLSCLSPASREPGPWNRQHGYEDVPWPSMSAKIGRRNVTAKFCRTNSETEPRNPDAPPTLITSHGQTSSKLSVQTKALCQAEPLRLGA